MHNNDLLKEKQSITFNQYCLNTFSIIDRLDSNIRTLYKDVKNCNESQNGELISEHIHVSHCPII